MSKRLISRGGILVGGGILLVLVTVALLSTIWTPYPVAEQNIEERLLPPHGAHPLGTDQYGRDVLSRMMAGARNSLLVALIAVAMGAGLGVPLGALAAMRSGWLDETVMRLNDFVFAFPAILSAVLITALRGPGAINSILAIGIFNIPVFARLTRGTVMGLMKQDFILAARVAGKGLLRTVAEHALPNAMPVLIVQATVQFAVAILAEAGLAYLGFSIQPPQPSWGMMLKEAQTLHQAPYLSLFPGLAIAGAVLGLNLFGDALRDSLDPRSKRP